MEIKPNNPAGLSISIPASPGQPATTAANYPVGTLLPALVERVVEQQSSGQQRLFQILLSIDGKPLLTESQQPFSSGQQLKLEVTADGRLRVLTVQPPTAQSAEAAIQAGLRQGISLQQEQAQPYNRLPALELLLQYLQLRAPDSRLSQLQEQVRQLLATLPRQDQVSDGRQLQQVIQNSGHLLEAKLNALTKQLSQVQPQTAARADSSAPARLAEALQQQPQLKQALERAIGQDTKAQLIRLAGQLVTLAPSTRATAAGPPSNTTPVAPGASQLPPSTIPIANRPVAESSRNPVPPATSINTVAQPETPRPPIPSAPLRSYLAQQRVSTEPTTSSAHTQARPSSIPGEGSGKAPAPVGGQPTTQTSQLAEPATLAGTPANQWVAKVAQATAAASGAPTGVSGTNTDIELPNSPLPQQIWLLLEKSGLPPSGQQTLSARDAFDLAVSTLLRQIASSLSKIQSHQLKSLSTRHRVAEGGTTPINSWYLEIPVYSDGQFRPIQLQIDEESATPQEGKERQLGRQWNITLGFNFESLGEFFATLTLVENTLSATFWSERPRTLEQIETELGFLKRSLQNKGLEIKQLECRVGKPPIQKSQLEQRLVDIKT